MDLPKFFYFSKSAEITLDDGETYIYYDTDRLIAYCIRTIDPKESYMCTYSNLQEMEDDIVNNLEHDYWLEDGELTLFARCVFCKKWGRKKEMLDVTIGGPGMTTVEYYCESCRRYINEIYY